MSDFKPKLFPEMTVYFDYIKGQKQTRNDPRYPDDYEFSKIEINDLEIGENLFDHLVDTFQDAWIEELELKKDELMF